MDKLLCRAGFAPQLVLLVAVISLTNWLFLPYETTIMLFEESGLIENATVFLYYLAIIAIWLFRPPALNRLSAAALHIILTAMAARELDLHKRLADMSLLKLRFWTNSGTPWLAKVEAAVILLLIIAAIAYLAKTHARGFFAQIRRAEPVAVTILTFFITLVVSKLADRSLGVLREVFGYIAPDWLMALGQSFEEPFEMILPLLIMLAVMQAALGGRRNVAP
ncbi:hypothetical protein D3870_18965 [Noviherbaspirillum cavernae]|uniref:Uncharacterized protein n=1 Tax=Noviherbaspirillum cavernae TaxID=2320862 RepID=A0A418WV12_9BURK|nr:hypothetical protein [Noviherbaspirillum cavernae]RJF96530.1 hypothetical protein D3870_18965 [Noviherbaspirillum cavernae]